MASAVTVQSARGQLVTYQLVYADRFNACIAGFRQQDDWYLAESMEVLTEFSTKPFGNPKLQLQPIKGIRDRSTLLKAKNRNHRRVLALANQLLD